MASADSLNAGAAADGDGGGGGGGGLTQPSMTGTPPPARPSEDVAEEAVCSIIANIEIV
jgi:hypothetical protein